MCINIRYHVEIQNLGSHSFVVNILLCKLSLCNHDHTMIHKIVQYTLYGLSDPIAVRITTTADVEKEKNLIVICCCCLRLGINMGSSDSSTIDESRKKNRGEG